MRTGTWNELKVDRIKDFGIYLTDGNEDVLLPRKQVPEGTKVGDTIKAFVYMDPRSYLPGQRGSLPPGLWPAHTVP